MNHRIVHIPLALLTGFIALTAIGGGIALLIGLEDARFPLEWLRDTPFPDYTVPALLLAIGVGGSALLACILIIRRHRLRLPVAMASGAIMMGYIVVEYLILQQEPPGPTVTEYLYFGLGASIVVIAGYAWLGQADAAGNPSTGSEGGPP